MKPKPIYYHINILSREHCETVQKRLFELGYEWHNGKVLQNTHATGIQLNYNGNRRIGYSATKGWRPDFQHQVFTLDDLYGPLFTFQPVEVKLNDSYSALVHKDKVVVGENEYPLEVVERLVKARGEMGQGEQITQKAHIVIHSALHWRVTLDQLYRIGFKWQFKANEGTFQDGKQNVIVLNEAQPSTIAHGGEFDIPKYPVKFTLDDLYGPKFTGKSSVEVDMGGMGAEYDMAKVSKEGVTVGCTTFSHSAIDALAEAVKKVKQDA